MGQREILKHLQQRRKRLFNGFYTATEIAREIKIDPSNCGKQLRKLYSEGIIERNVATAWSPAYRLTDETYKSLEKEEFS